MACLASPPQVVASIFVLRMGGGEEGRGEEVMGCLRCSLTERT